MKALKDVENRTRDFMMKDAYERYKDFIKEYPQINERVNQKYIASFIGIRESSLSRLKKMNKN